MNYEQAMKAAIGRLVEEELALHLGKPLAQVRAAIESDEVKVRILRQAAAEVGPVPIETVMHAGGGFTATVRDDLPMPPRPSSCFSCAHGQADPFECQSGREWFLAGADLGTRGPDTNAWIEAHVDETTGLPKRGAPQCPGYRLATGGTP